MPGGEDLVHIGPLQLLTLEDGLVVGPLDGRVLKAHGGPGEQVLLLAGGGGPVPQPQQGHEPGQGLPLALAVPDVGGGPVLVHEAQAGPGVALPLDLPQGGPAAGAVALGGPLAAVAHQQEDHVRGQAHIVVQPQQGPHVRGGELLAQLLLHRPGQGPELLPLQGAGHVGPGVLRGLLPGGGGDRRRGGGGGLSLGQAHQPLALQGLKGGGEPLRGPAQGGPELLAVGGAPVLDQGNVQQGGVPISGADQPPGRRARQDHALLLRQMQHISAHGSTSLHKSFCPAASGGDSLLFYTMRGFS